MKNEIEKIYDSMNDGLLGEDRIWRTSCKCMGDDNLTFQVCTDDEHPEIFLEVWMDCSSYYNVWDTPRWSRPFRTFWNRLKGACGVIFFGGRKVTGAFIFRGEDQIDALTETIQSEKSRMKSIQSRRNRKDGRKSM